MNDLFVDLARAEHEARLADAERRRRARRAAVVDRLQRRARRLARKSARVSRRAERAASRARLALARAI